MSNKTEKLLAELKSRATKAQAENKTMFERLRKKKPKDLDETVHELHEEVFEEIDCLSCANCCKSISPIITDRDIERLAKHFRMKVNDFIAEYLLRDNDGDYVYKSSPCPFLMPDNYCMVYEQRPKACREYPHTDRRKFHQILKLTLKNTFYCPAVYLVVEGLKEKRQKS